MKVTSTTGRTPGEFIASAHDARVPQQDLKLVKQIGEGHSALVFVAQTADAHEVVVKVVRRDEKPDRMKKLHAELEREQKTSMTFAHVNPAFVRIFSAGDLKMGKYMMPAAVMEKVEGKPLADWRAGAAKRSVPVALALIGRLADVLSDLEKAGFRHNDLHTENLFAVNDDPATLRIIDLGRASKLDAPTKKSNITFAAPERRTGGGTTGVASDIYTVGVVLFTLLNGTPPALQAKEKGVRSSVIDALADGPVAAVLKRALATKPSDRFASFAEMRDAIAALL